MQICDVLKCQINETDISKIYRTKKTTKNRTPPSIVIKFASSEIRDKILASRRAHGRVTYCQLGLRGDYDVHINERLTYYNLNLLWLTRNAAAALKYRFAWSKNGTVYMRKNENSPILRILYPEDIPTKIGSAHYGVVCLLLVYFASAAVVKDPNDLRCSWKDPALDKCMTSTTQKVMPRLVKGIPKYGIFPIDPLRIKLLDLPYTPGRTLDVRTKFMEVDLIGFKSAAVQAVRVNREETTFEVDLVFTEHFVLKGDYEAKGKVLVLPVDGAGPFQITLHNMTATLKYKGHQEKRKGKVYVKMDEVSVPMKVSKITLDFKNLFKGNPQISQAINDALNDNWDAALEDMLPAFEAGIGEAFKEIANRALSKLALSDLFKDA